MKKLAIISDIHGCFETLEKLIAKGNEAYPDGREVIFCGDLIDRGPRSRDVIEYAMKNKIRCVMGNHEHLMLAHYKKASGYNSPVIWMHNGGIWTTDSFAGRVPLEVLKWAEALPIYIKEDNLLISHTGHGLMADKGGTFQALWERSKQFPADGLFRVFGHTQEEEPIITDTYAMIDTGAAYKHHGYGKMTCFLWPEKTYVQQEFCESPVLRDEEL